jgi:sugar phosphate isomerase/epimerase
MHERAQAVADAAEVADAFTTHEEGDGEYADAYLYPSLALLPSTLDALDEAGVEYDYVDLPADAPGALAEDLRSRFKGTGVSVTGGPRGQNPVAAAKARLLAW